MKEIFFCAAPLKKNMFETNKQYDMVHAKCLFDLFLFLVSTT